jgi:vacuolar-type H+-ATPase subunit H
VRGDVHIHDQRIDIERLAFGLLDGTFKASGVYDSKPLEPRIDLDLDIVEVDLTKTVEKLGFVGKVAPLATAMEGRISTKLKLGGRFTDGMNLLIDSVGGLGALVGHGLRVSGSDTLNLAATALGDVAMKNLKLSEVALDFEIDEGRMKVSPFNFKAGPVAASFGGSHRFGGELDYSLTLQLPAKKIAGAAGSKLGDLLAKSPFGGTKLPSTLPVIVGIGGTVKKPIIKLDFGKMGATAVEQMKEVVREQVEKLSDAARAAAERRLETARTAAKKARTRAKQAASTLKQRGYTAADKAVKRAGGPLAKAAAKIAAEQAKKQVDRAYKDALKRADQRLDQAVAAAQKEYDDTIDAAEAEISNPGAGKITP